MILEDILNELREVEAGHRLLHRPLAKQAADALELMVDRVRYLEERPVTLEVAQAMAEDWKTSMGIKESGGE